MTTVTSMTKPAMIILYDPPPIPIRDFDWSALRSDYEPGMPIGRGASEAEAVADLLEQESDE
jgi:hypothetical protein